MPLSLLAPLWLASAGLGPAELAPGEVDAVELPWWRYEMMRSIAEDEPPRPGPWVADREVDLRPVAGGWELEARFTIRAMEAGFLWQPLCGPTVELRRATLGRDLAPVVPLPSGTMFGAWIEADTTHQLAIVAFVPGSIDDRLDLALMPAARGRLRATVPDRVLVPVTDGSGDEAPPLLEGGVVWSGASSLALELRDPDRAPPPRETLAVAHAGVGLTVGDAELRGRAHLQWELRHGALPRVRARVAGLGEDLTVEGPNVATWSRSGDTLEVELAAPARGRVDLDLRWTVALAAGDEARMELPRIEPEAWRSESSLQLARDGEIEVIPALDEWTALAAAELPPWGQGLVEGTPTAAYQHAGGSAPGHLDLLRFVPVPGPPTVVDVASYTVATTEEGRVLMRAYYELRNDRGSHLLVRPPEGLRIIGARVAGQTALPSRDDEGAWRIPLKRSLETVEGLLSFPVEVILLGEQDPWDRTERRQLPLPTLDAPIAASRITLHLPPRYRSRLEQGEHDIVDTFGEGEGLTYGRGVGDVGSAVADALFQEAVEGYMANEFGEAQAKLEQLEQLGVSNENMSRLQANLDVIEGQTDAKDKGDLTVQRRVKEQAKARAVEDFRQQERLIEEAERAAQAGNYDQAEAQYQAALEIGGKLEKLEQTESVEQQARNVGLQRELKNVSSKKANKTKKKRKGRRFGGSDMANTSSRPSKPRIALSGGDDPLGGVGDTSAAVIHEIDEDRPMSSEEPDEAFADMQEMKQLEGQARAQQELEKKQQEAEHARLLELEMDARVAAGEELAPEADPEPMPEPEPVLTSRRDDRDDVAVAERSVVRARNTRRRRTRSRRTLDTKFKSTRPPPPRTKQVDMMSADQFARRKAAVMEEAGYGPGDPPVDPADAPLDGLPAPEVTASALSVVVPATGQTVRYEQLLIDANQTQTITIDARRRLRR